MTRILASVPTVDLGASSKRSSFCSSFTDSACLSCDAKFKANRPSTSAVGIGKGGDGIGGSSETRFTFTGFKGCAKT